ncbi:MAG: hypothetical protein HY512_02340 [Candidatus Aenigmarchaeota archaeon]|nr:hypothetical protein [Candidatus Aenigmarchaeota archaeon]
MPDLVFRTYSKGHESVNAQEVIDMLRSKPIEIDYDVELDPASFSKNLGWHYGVIVGLPSDRHHNALSSSFRDLGYLPVERKAEPVTQPAGSEPTREERADAAYKNALVHALWEGVGALNSG